MILSAFKYAYTHLCSDVYKYTAVYRTHTTQIHSH